MLDNLFTDEEKTWGNKNLVLLNDTVNIVNRSHKQRRNLKENENEIDTYTENKRDAWNFLDI